MSKLKIRCSPITGIIYAGTVSKTGLWGKNKTDVTNDAINSVTQSLLQTQEKLQFSYNGKQYELKVVELKGDNK